MHYQSLYGIFQISDRGTVRVPWKRKRTSTMDTEITGNTSLNDQQCEVDLVRDPDHYREDGDCVILVQDTLFKVCSYDELS
jgi:hypothetical protein